jgi:hypothetical protein
MGYIATKGRYGSLGAIAPGDFGAVYSAQRNEARRLFGETSTHLLGRTDINYPNLSGDYALKLLRYWRSEAARVKTKAEGGALQGITDSALGAPATRAQWVRAVAALNSFSAGVVEINARAVGGSLILQMNAKTLWDMLDNVVLPMRGINEAPSAWDLLGEAFVERIKELGSAGSGLIKLAVFGGIAYLGYSAYMKRKG